jgi:hypothetical protein
MQRVVITRPASRRFMRMTAVLAAPVAALILASSAMAASSISVDPSVKLTNKIGVTVFLTVTCPSGSTGALFGQVEQGNGKDIAIAQISLFNMGGPSAVICDDAPHTYAVSGLAAPTGAPFHGGPAIVSLTGSFCGPNPGGGFSCETVATGPVAVKLKP